MMMNRIVVLTRRPSAPLGLDLNFGSFRAPGPGRGRELGGPGRPAAGWRSARPRAQGSGPAAAARPEKSRVVDSTQSLVILYSSNRRSPSRTREHKQASRSVSRSNEEVAEANCSS
eukprot:765421-Hanusia_phi.AAC.3